MDLFLRIDTNNYKCTLCPHYCKISIGKRGLCGVRENTGEKIESLVYSKVCAINIDPVEKKPLYHFLPGTKTLSIGTVGCNMKCLNCQNYHISQEKPKNIQSKIISPEELVNFALNNDCKSISYTYNEPTVYYEYMLETAKLAKKYSLKNIMVSNGYINPEPLGVLLEYIDAVNVDLKSFENDVYKKLFGAKIQPVLDSIRQFKDNRKHIEITNLLIPDYTDKIDFIGSMCKWISEEIGTDTPIHFSRFFPVYKLRDLPPTDLNKINIAVEIAYESGLNYVYKGNVRSENITKCIKCGNTLVIRNNYNVAIAGIDSESRCSMCLEQINGVWI